MADTPTDELLASTLAEIEARTDRFSGDQVAEAIRRLRQKGDPSPRPMKWVAELMAFDFCEDYRNKETSWGTYFGPMMAGSTENGTRREYPSLKMVTPEVLAYWTGRAREARHVILKSRYAALVWDLTKTATSQNPPVEMAHIRIDSVVAGAAANADRHEVDTIKKLRHALQLAVSINDSVRVEGVRDAIIAYGDCVAEDEKLGLWCFVYDSLFGQRKVALTKEQQTKIIGDLEARLGRTSDTSGGRPLLPFAAEAAATQLADFYRSKNQPAEVRRVLLRYGGAFEKAGESTTSMQAQAWLEKVHQVYRGFGLKEDADRILRRIRELGPKAVEELKPIMAEVKITNEDMAQFVQGMTEGDLDTVVRRIVIHYLPRRNQVEKQIKELAASAPLSFLFRAQIMDHKGRPAAVVGPVEQDLDGRVVMQIAQNMQFVSVFQRQVMEAFVSKFAITPEAMTDRIYRTRLFDEDAKPILGRGIKAYLNGDWLVAIHLLMPQVENAIRNLVESIGGTVLKPNRLGGLDTKTFDELLRDDLLPAVFSPAGDDVLLYLRVLFTDRRGLNLRNRVFHGLAPASTFNPAFADMVVHSLLILSLVRLEEEPAAGEQEGGGPTNSPTPSGDQEQGDGRACQ